MMWCPNCRADVAAELSSDNRRSLCTRCGTDLELSSTHEVPIPDATRDARDLLARWSAESWLEPIQESVPPEMPSPENAIPLLTNASIRTAMRRPRAEPPRVDTPRVETARVTPPFEPTTPAGSTSASVEPTIVQSTNDAPSQDPPWLALLGQLTAYLGVGGLTCGAALVLWSYFGGPAQYAPTGWLLTTVGQMLLFLGVVTLISCGLDQTASEVRRGLARLEEHLLRLERAGRDRAATEATPASSTAPYLSDAA